MARLKVPISGASIAGPAPTLRLAEYGADVTVVERWPELRTGGQLVDLRGVFRVTLRRMGVDTQARPSPRTTSTSPFSSAATDWSPRSRSCAPPC